MCELSRSALTTPDAGAHASGWRRSQDYTLPGGPGVVWDHAQSRIWALGSFGIHRYTYNFDRQKPGLKEEAVFELPEPGGHDLFPAWSADAVLVTTGARIWRFDPEQQTFSPYPVLPEAAGVESVSEREREPTTVYMQACESWWCDSVRCAGASKTSQRDGAQFYKTRWWVPNRFSYGLEPPEGPSAAEEIPALGPAIDALAGSLANAWKGQNVTHVC